MCDFSGRLIAWLDRELCVSEAAGLERHVQVCLECRGRLDAYKRTSRAFDEYCRAEAASKAPDKSSLRASVVSGAAAAALVALLLVFPRTHVQPFPSHPSAETSPAIAHPAIVLATDAALAPVKKIHRRHDTPAPIQAPVQSPLPRAFPRTVQSQYADWLTAGPDIRIAIPADAMFPPGAIPEGVDFIADIGIAADGSAQGVRPRP